MVGVGQPDLQPGGLERLQPDPLDARGAGVEVRRPPPTRLQLNADQARAVRLEEEGVGEAGVVLAGVVVVKVEEPGPFRLHAQPRLKLRLRPRLAERVGFPLFPLFLLPYTPEVPGRALRLAGTQRDHRWPVLTGRAVLVMQAAEQAHWVVTSTQL